MKIAIRSHGDNSINKAGGLEHRFVVNWAEFLKYEGHHVSFFDPNKGCDSSFDLAIDVPLEQCSNIKAKYHIHNSFNPKALKHPTVQNNPCYQEGNYFFSSPYRFDYDKSCFMATQENFKHIPVFMPLPYPDHLKPPVEKLGFERAEILWANKGNFDCVFDENHAKHYYVTDGLNVLKALIALNRKFDFKVTFLVDSKIRIARPEWEVEGYISQLKHVDRFDMIPWNNLLKVMSKCKLNTHPGGLTSAVNEAVFLNTLPMTPVSDMHLNVLPMAPDPETSSVESVYDAYEKAWVDKQYYTSCLNAYEAEFQDHRTTNVRKHWATLMSILENRKL